MNAAPSHDGAEQALLAHVLHYPLEQPRLADEIQERFFNAERHRLIWEAMGRIAVDSGAGEINLLTVEQALGDSFETIGGHAYLYGLDLQLPDEGRIARLIEIVRELYVRRQIIEQCSKVAADGYGTEEPTDALLSRLAGAIAALEKDRAADEYSGMDAIVSGIDLDEEPKEFLGIRTGLDDWDRKTLGLQPGHLDVIGARTSHGKSSLMMLAGLTAAGNDFKVAIESLEMPKEELGLRAISILSQVPLKSLQLRRIGQEWKKQAERAKWALYSYGMAISDQPTRTVEQIAASARRRKTKHGLDLLMIDYLKQVQTADRFDNTSLKYGHITGLLKRLAKDLEIPIVLLHQIGRRAEQREGQIPTLADLEWSASVEQDADQVTFIHRPWVNSRKDEDIGKAKIIVAKNRGGETGMVPAYFEGQTVTFRGLDQNERATATGW